MTTPPAQLLQLQEEALHLSELTNSFLIDADRAADPETRLTELAMRAEELRLDELYEPLKSNTQNCINTLIDLILIKKYL